MIERAAATVFSAQVRSSDERTILVEAGGFAPVRWFLEYAASAEGHEEPPKKRRRLRKHESEAEDWKEQATAIRADCIPIHRVTIDLHFPETAHTKPASQAALDADVEFDTAEHVAVTLFGITTSNTGTRLRLVTPGNPQAMLILECDSIPATACEGLGFVALPGQLKTTRDGGRRRDNPATLLHCSLRRSHGQLYTAVRLEATVFWRSGLSAFPAGMPIGKARVYEDYELLAKAYNDESRDEVDHSQPWTPSDFYDSVHVPDKSTKIDPSLDGILESELFPFQKRAVSWMLGREGVKMEKGQAVQNDLPAEGKRHGFYLPVKDAEGKHCYVNYLQGVVSREPPNEGDQLSGGLLAEEMGLGKTVELLSLLCLHRRPEADYDCPTMDAHSGTQVLRSRATLIVTPPTLTQQWMSELRQHAPALKVCQYGGVTRNGKSDAQTVDEFANDYDVVLTTYNTLAHDLHFAEDPPDRNMRHARKHERRRSPLVQVQWWRVCLDEAQLVESGVTAAAKVAERLPRVHSWAVSGTPLRKNVQDLHGLLIFLRYRPLSDSPKLWSHLITNHRHLFRRIWGEIALRHTKSAVREELHLPPQKRVVLTVPFSAVEQPHYSTLFEQMCEEVGLESDGSPKSGTWDPEDPATVEAMRNWLTRLRQTCLHPQVGGRNRKALGRGQAPLRTVAEVLEVMIDQNETGIRTEERLLLSSQLLRAHIVGNNGEDEHRSEKALAIYKTAMESAARIAEESRQRLANFKAELAAKDEAVAETDAEDSDSESAPMLGRLRKNLRTAIELQHACTFFAATAYFQIKTNESITKPESEEFKQLEEQETALYDAAKQLRREVLLGASCKAEGTMRKIRTLQFTQMPALNDLDLVGIEGRRLVEKSDELFDVIRELTGHIVDIRAKMAEYLLKPLVDEDEEGIETTGEEYETSTKQQDELFVYFDAVRSMQADLNSFITGESAPLIDHEVKMLIRDATWYLDSEYDSGETVVHAPELLLKLMETRNSIRGRMGTVGSIRGLIQEARSLETTMQWQSGARAESERALIRKHLTTLQKVFSSYTKVLAGLEKEVDLFRNGQSHRIEFYRQLQELSDVVAPYKEDLDPVLDLRALQPTIEKEEQQSKNLAQLKTRNRFLLHLRDESEGQTAPKICVICQCSFEQGVITRCGHVFDRECINHWWTTHRTCPVCKQRLSTVDFHPITYKPQGLKAQEEIQAGSSSPGSEQSSSTAAAIQSSIYSDVDSKLMDQIKSIDLPSSYGTKIDTLGRHLHWIREHDPGAKSIVFSQYREFLDVLGVALQGFKIGYSRLGHAGAVEKFRGNPSIDCLLLDAKTDSSGLTLVNATHVFICEPLIQTAVELQAIARVHRIGQTRPTTVWMYLVNDTVEESIYEISVARRLAHVQRSNARDKSRSTTPAPLQEIAIDAANSAELQSAPLHKLLVSGKGGGEVVGNDDLWQCLFGKAQKTAVQPSVEVEREVGRHSRAEAAESRRA